MEKYTDGKYIVEQIGTQISYLTNKGVKIVEAKRIRALHPKQITILKKLGADPTNYFACGPMGEAVLRNAARYVVEAAIAAQIEADQKHRAAEQAARQERLHAAMAALPEGHTLCTRTWANGDLMSAEYIPVSGGCRVIESDQIKSLAGTEFYAIPTEKIEAADAGKAAKQAEKEKAEKVQAEKIESARKEAAATGQNIVISTWATEGCMNGNHDECSFDRAEKYINPKGEINTRYICCY